MRTKKLHKSSIRAGIIAFICLFCVVALTNAATKDLFVWNGANDDWTTASSWTITRGTSPGAGTYPNAANDSVIVSNGGTPTISSGTITVYSLTVSNATGATSGSILTINSGATLNVSGNGTTAIPTVQLKGGNIVNNGTLNITTSATGAGNGILCTTPAVAPSSPTTYSYSGTGSLSINTSAGSGNAVYFNGQNANSTYKIAFPSSTTLTLKANAVALSVAGSTTSPVFISGSGFTLGTSQTGVQAGIITQNGNGTNVTIDTGTNLTLYSLTGNTTKAVYLYFTTGGGSFTNNGTINVSGPIAGGINLTNSMSTGTNALSFTNNGTINMNVAISATYAGVLNLPTQAANGNNTNTITNAGSMTLVNTSAVANTGYCLYTGNTTYTSGSLLTTINNTGTFELNGTLTSTGGTAGRLTINNNNNGTFILNLPASGTSCLDKAIFNNNSGGTLDCKGASISSGSGYVVTVNSGSTLKTSSATAYCLSGSGALQNSGANYVFNGAVAQTTGTNLASSANNVEINNAAGVTLTSTSALINGTLTLTSGAFNIGANILTLKGLVANNGGTLTHYTSTPTTFGSLVFNGSSAQNFPALTNNKCKLVTINNAAGVSLSAGIAIDSTLTLTSGKLSLGANDLTIGTKGSISGTSSSNYIVTDGSGKLNQTVNSSVSTLFPVGASVSSYDPVTVNPTTGTVFAVKAYATLSGTPVYGVRYNQKEWDLTPTVASSTVISLTPSNLTESVTSPVIGHYVSGAYVNNNTVSVNAGTFTGTFDTFSPFVTGANVDVTGLRNNSEADKSTIYTEKGTVIIENAVGQTVNIYSVTGSKVLSVNANSNKETLTIGKGIYLLTVNSKTQKIVVQ